MIGPLNGAGQQQTAYLNPFQQKPQEQLQRPDAKRPEQNRPQPKTAQAAGSQSTESPTDSRTNLLQTKTGTESDQSSSARQQRGSLVDITV
ncbi:MAG: hypothetical protein KDJ15_06440 [Alphaproteobacteria bacterium]|nr:hypothetical protein [Alphaproteobacteria bacterium]